MAFLDDAQPVTPPVVVRIAMLGAYCYCYYLGLSCMILPWATPDKLAGPARNAQLAIQALTYIYAVDASLAASPLHWCCMRSIPPRNVLVHHIPYVLGMAPSVYLVWTGGTRFFDCLVSTPTAMTYMGAGCLTSSNEALWVASSFFTNEMLESKSYRVGQKLFALAALSQFLVIGGLSAGFTIHRLSGAMLDGQDVLIRALMLIPCVAFFCIVPFVQIPLLIGAWGRFKDALFEEKRGALLRP
mmetsp:Transcript_19833/g.44969  ORF Transcript_19833/g.44969 Transcript_19833/m.44969 type:complete len:243 (-) Transcript_19833:213-941(-)|eukprot:CAMPEP_0172646096 /NCGR_PEP_ID=MMETSP1068-20121228/240066_1 /TAXON_ID=35684 /ORGANISM="Pseudopedinella elastica, Strain CCMP716" /LENGTH=242 /DNA_ID=CAMNT_0013460347 /DNA_START=481 /DNA_END=1209 /DNA_ORIENTATION=+